MRVPIHRVVSTLLAASVVGCATPSTAPPTVVIRIADGSVWIDTDEIGRFRCDKGLLTCDDALGRLSQRRCRCLE
jgi:hypothetical protein